jgi:hypothetical protein
MPVRASRRRVEYNHTCVIMHLTLYNDAKVLAATMVLGENIHDRNEK